MHVWTKTRVETLATRVPMRAKAERPLADWHSGHTRATGTAKIAQQSPGEGYMYFPQLAPILISDVLRLCPVGRVERTFARFSCAPTRLDAHPIHAC